VIKVVALTPGRHIPSARFRVRQHIAPLRELGVSVREYIPAIDSYSGVPLWPSRLHARLAPHLPFFIALKMGARLPGVAASRCADVTWLQRSLLPGRFTLERFLRDPVVYDLDDADWLTREGRSAGHIAAIARRAAVVVAGNRYLAQWLGDHARDVRIVPTAIDTDRFRPSDSPDVRRSDRFVIGWTGSASTLRYLEAIEPMLSRFLSDVRTAELLVIAERPPRFRQLPAERVQFLRWSRETEAEGLRRMDVGIMPLPDDEWTRGKCSFKMLQYMASALPVVASPVGLNAEILAMADLGLPATADAEWYHALSVYVRDPDLAQRHGRAGRAVAEARFSRNVVAVTLAEIFRQLA
jgi:glycosyltransferase involved in cell wall biosynthesis